MRGLAKTSRSRGGMELVDRDRPKPGPDEALVEVDYAGLCGSDAGIYEFESAFERMNLPTVIGHEYSGRVVEVGEGVTKFAVGDASSNGRSAAVATVTSVRSANRTSARMP